MFINFIVKCLAGFVVFLFLGIFLPLLWILSFGFLVIIPFYPMIKVCAKKDNKLCKEVLK